jgi:hypothetical protein
MAAPRRVTEISISATELIELEAIARSRGGLNREPVIHTWTYKIDTAA